MTEELIDLTEFEPSTVAALGEGTLKNAGRDLAYTIGFIYQNRTPTADLEGVFEINDQLESRSREGSPISNAILYHTFIEKSSGHTPASAALLATRYFDSVLRVSGSGRWLENISKGFIASGVTQDFQVDAICGLLSRVSALKQQDPDNWMLEFSKNTNRDHLMIMLVLAHSAVKEGVVPKGKTQEDLLKSLDEAFIRFNQPGGFATLNRLAHRFLTHEAMSDTISAAELSASGREKRLTTIVNPLFMLYVNSAHKVQLFDTTAREILNDLTRLLRSSFQKPQDVYLFNHEYSRQLVLRTLMATPDVWHEQLKRKPGKGSNATAHVSRIEDRLAGLLLELDSLHYESEVPLQKMVSNRLFSVLMPWVAKMSDCDEKSKLRLLDSLSKNVDFEACFHASRGKTKALFTKHITESRRDLISILSRKERGRLIEDELGM